jgi:hypothetical protein
MLFLVVEVYINIDKSSQSNTSVAAHQFSQIFPSSGVLTINKADGYRLCLHQAPCILHLVASSWKGADFHIYLSQGGSFQGVVNSEQALSYPISFGQYMYFYIWIPTDSKELDITLKPTSGDQDMYLQFGPIQLDGVDNMHYHFRSNKWGRDIEDFHLNSSNEHYCTGCYASIAVYGYEAGTFIMQSSVERISSMLRKSNPSDKSSSGWNYFTGALICILAFIIVFIATNYEQFKKLILANYNAIIAHPQMNKHYSSANTAAASMMQTEESKSEYTAPRVKFSRDELARYLALAEEESFSDQESSPYFTTEQCAKEET